MLGPNPFETIAASSGIINVYEKSHGRDTSDTVRFRGPIWTSSDSDAYQNPVDFDGITGSNISKSCWLLDYRWKKRFRWRYYKYR
jgi:hypothetical protein